MQRGSNAKMWMVTPKYRYYITLSNKKYRLEAVSPFLVWSKLDVRTCHHTPYPVFVQAVRYVGMWSGSFHQTGHVWVRVTLVRPVRAPQTILIPWTWWPVQLTHINPGKAATFGSWMLYQLTVLIKKIKICCQINFNRRSCKYRLIILRGC